MLLQSRLVSLFGALLLLVSGLLWPSATQSVRAAPAGVTPGTLSQVASFGNNPSGLKMYIYVPRNLAANPALLVAVHYCSGSATAFYNGSYDYVAAAEQYGYIIVFPESTHSEYSNCFDVWSPQALTRGGGSDPVGIMSMVSWTTANYNIDSSRIYAMGVSSGAMMTNVLLAEYPDVFAAGAAFMGVPATCFATGSATNFWNSQCSNGQISKTAQQWGDAARAMYPGYKGSYPRIQLWHGSTDSVLSYNNFAEEIKQWTNLHGVSATPAVTDSPKSNWTRTRYGNTTAQPPVEAISVQGTGHDMSLAGMPAYAIAFLGLNSSGSGGSPTVPAAPASLTAAAGNASVSLSWAASPGATSYTVKRATTSGGPYTDVATGVTTTSYTNTGLTNGTTYYYVVSASNSAGSSVNSAQASATPASGGTSTGNLVLQYKAGDTNATDNQIKPYFNIKNNGTTPVNLSGLKIRYYFTKDGTADMNGWIDWAQIGSSNISAAFANFTGSNTDTYVELSFSAAADSIPAGGQTGDIQLRMSKADWSNFNEANDYSYDPTKTAYADWNRVTLHQNGTLVWGVQP
ncbi:hypothetical protein YSY43_36820 [Paenibacillus sp. YSY-4.3]